MEKTLLAPATLAAMDVPAWPTMPLLGEKAGSERAADHEPVHAGSYRGPR
jgi:hypothetical protein